MFPSVLRVFSIDKLVLLNTFAVDFAVFSFGEGKRRKEFAEWYVAWRAEWHNYAKYDLRRE